MPWTVFCFGGRIGALAEHLDCARFTPSQRVGLETVFQRREGISAGILWVSGDDVVLSRAVPP